MYETNVLSQSDIITDSGVRYSEKTNDRELLMDHNNDILSEPNSGDLDLESNIMDFDFLSCTTTSFKTDTPAKSDSCNGRIDDRGILRSGTVCINKSEILEDSKDLSGLNGILDDIISEKIENSDKHFIDFGIPKIAMYSGKGIREYTMIESEGEMTPKLSKCLRLIEDKVDVKREKMQTDVQRDIRSLQHRRPAYKRKISDAPPLLHRTTTNNKYNKGGLYSLLTHKNNLRPLSFLEQLTLIDFSTLPAVDASMSRPTIETDLQMQLRELMKRKNSE